MRRLVSFFTLALVVTYQDTASAQAKVRVDVVAKLVGSEASSDFEYLMGTEKDPALAQDGEGCTCTIVGQRTATLICGPIREERTYKCTISGVPCDTSMDVIARACEATINQLLNPFCRNEFHPDQGIYYCKQPPMTAQQ